MASLKHAQHQQLWTRATQQAAIYMKQNLFDRIAVRKAQMLRTHLDKEFKIDWETQHVLFSDVVITPDTLMPPSEAYGTSTANFKVISIYECSSMLQSYVQDGATFLRQKEIMLQAVKTVMAELTFTVCPSSRICAFVDVLGKNISKYITNSDKVRPVTFTEAEAACIAKLKDQFGGILSQIDRMIFIHEMLA